MEQRKVWDGAPGTVGREQAGCASSPPPIQGRAHDRTALLPASGLCQLAWSSNQEPWQRSLSSQEALLLLAPVSSAGVRVARSGVEKQWLPVTCGLRPTGPSGASCASAESHSSSVSCVREKRRCAQSHPQQAVETDGKCPAT